MIADTTPGGSRTVRMTLAILALALPLLVTYVFSSTARFFPSFWAMRLLVMAYGASLALAASTFEKSLKLRLCCAAVVVIIMSHTFFAVTFDLVMILSAGFLSGIVASGGPFRYAGVSWLWIGVREVFFRALRGAFAVLFAWQASMLPLPTSGNDPAGGGDITEVSFTFAAITYIIVAGLLVFDWIAIGIRREIGEKLGT